MATPTISGPSRRKRSEISGLYQNPNAVEAIRAADNAQWRNAWNAFAADPIGIVKDLSLSNAAQIAPMAGLGIAGAAVKGVPGLMLGFAGGSFPVDYAMSLVEYLRRPGHRSQGLQGGRRRAAPARLPRQVAELRGDACRRRDDRRRGRRARR
jgi:hypothetical protein